MTNSIANMTVPALVKACGRRIDKTRHTLDAARHRRATPDNLLNLGTDLADCHQQLSEAITYWAVAAVAAGRSWSEIGTALGITRQGARQRFSKYVEDARLDV